MIRRVIENQLEEAASAIGIANPSISLSRPANPSHGDFATSIALKYAKEQKMTPLELAHKIASHLDTTGAIERIEVIAPGFINIFLSQKTLLEVLNTPPQAAPLSSQKVIFEFGQPNTHKLPHIGHLFSYIYGESLSRIFQFQGYSVIRANYQGDIGLHVAKCLWYIILNRPQLESCNSLQEQIDFLQKAYQEGSRAYEEEEDAKKEIDGINTALYKENDGELMKLWELTRGWSIKYYDSFQKRLGITYDRQYFETETWKLGKQTVLDNIGHVFEKSQHAVIFRGENHGLHTRVFINKHGNPTYEAKEIGLYEAKNRDFAPFDLSVTTTASEQNEYFKVVFKAIEKIHPEAFTSFKHLGYGMIQLTSGKMSSRTGDIIGAIELVALTKSAIAQSFTITDETALEQIAMAAIKYSFLKSDPFKNMTFDLEKSIARDGDSGPYLLYTYVRTRSIVSKSGSPTSIDSFSRSSLNEEELSIVRLLSQFPEVIESASKQYSPSLIATYLFSLAQAYNLFYQKHQVLTAEESDRSFRLAITDAVGSVIKAGLHLLGIETVEKM